MLGFHVDIFQKSVVASSVALVKEKINDYTFTV